MTMLCMGLSGCGKQQEPLTAAFLKVGKADAIVISRGEEALLIDTGEEDDGEKILESLRLSFLCEPDGRESVLEKKEPL